MNNEKWLPIQKECYERNCVCEDCMYKAYNKNCTIKYIIMKKIKLYGLQDDIKTKTVIEDDTKHL